MGSESGGFANGDSNGEDVGVSCALSGRFRLGGGGTGGGDGWCRDFDRPTREDVLDNVDRSVSTLKTLVFRSGCVGGGSGGSSVSGRGGVREGELLGDANRRSGGREEGEMPGADIVVRLNGDSDAFATCSYERTEPPTVDAEGLCVRRGGRDGTRLCVIVRPPEPDADDAELLGVLLGLLLRMRRRGAELLFSTSSTRSSSSFCSAFLRLCAIRVACRDCCMRVFEVLVVTLREACGKAGTGGRGSRAAVCGCWALMDACRGGGMTGGLRGGNGGILLS